MRVRFKGSISFQNKVAEVFQHLLEKRDHDFSAIVMKDPSGQHEGRIYVAQGKYVCGADLRTPPFKEANIEARGYPALKLLCSVAAASYEVVTGSPADFGNVDMSLNIALSNILKALPHLPEEEDILVDEDKLLNRIFENTSSNLNPYDDQNEAVKIAMAKKEAAESNPPSKPPPAQEWHAVDDIDIALPIDGERKSGEHDKFISLQERAQREIGTITPQARKRHSPPVRLMFNLGRRIQFLVVSIFTATKAVAIPVLLIAALFVAVLAGAFLLHSVKLPTLTAPRLDASSNNSSSSTAKQSVDRTIHAGRPLRAVQHKSEAEKSVAKLAPPNANSYVLDTEAPVQHRRAYSTAPDTNP